MAKNRGIKTEDRYWDAREREMKNLVQQEKFLKRYDKNVKEIYRRMLYDAQKEIESFYGRYASKEGITINEAKKRVSRMDVEAFGKMAKHMVETKDFSPEANAALRLYNLTMKVNRLELLKARIGLRLVDGFDEIDKLTETLLTNAGVHEFKRQAGILGESVINPEQKAEAIAKSSFQNANFSDRIWMYQDQLRNEIANDLRSGLIQGKSSQEMARKLRRRFDVSMYNASRLARTEMARVQTEAQMQSFERNGYTHYVFIARESACDHCAPLDGMVFAVKDIRPGVNAPPIHPHCFCSIAAATGEQVLQKGNEDTYELINPLEFQKFAEYCKSTLSESEFRLLQRHSYEGRMSGYFQSPNSFHINYMVRNGEESHLSHHDKEILKTIRKAIQGVTTEKNYLLYRYDSVDILESFFEFDGVNIDCNVSGKIVKLRNSFSTSMVEGRNVFMDRPVRWNIQAKKGSHIFANDNAIESEAVIKDGTELEILDLIRTDQGYIINARIREEASNENEK